jgi:hypothetical protein
MDVPGQSVPFSRFETPCRRIVAALPWTVDRGLISLFNYWASKEGVMNDRNNQRVLNRRGARELTQQEAERISGGHHSFLLTLSGMPTTADDSVFD